MNPTPSQPERPEPPEGYELNDSVDHLPEGSMIRSRFYPTDNWGIATYAGMDIKPEYHLHWWVAIPATRTAPEAVAGERKPSSKHKFNCSQCGQIKPCSCEEETIEDAAPTPPEADKDAEPFGGIKGPDSGVIIPPFNYPLPPEIAEKIGDEKPTVHLITGPNGECICGTDEKTCAEVVAKLMAGPPSELTTARATIAEQDAEITKLRARLDSLESALDGRLGVCPGKDRHTAPRNGRNHMSDLQSKTPIIDDAFAELEESPKLIENRVQFRRRLAALELAANGLRDALQFVQDYQRKNCDGQIGWRSHPRAIAGDVLVKHILAAENALAAFATLTKQPADQSK